MADAYGDEWDDEYESEDAHGLGADEAVESDYRESLVLLIDASPEMLLPYDGSPPVPQTQQQQQQQQPQHQHQKKASSLGVALELAYSLMRNLLTAGSRDEIAVLFYGLAPAKEGGGFAAAAAATTTAAAEDPTTTTAIVGVPPPPPPPPEPTTTQQQAFPGVVPLQPLCVPGADAMRRLRDLWRGDRARFEAQVGRVLGEDEGDEDDDDEQAAAAAAAAALAAAGGGGTLQPMTQATITTTAQPNNNTTNTNRSAAKRAVRRGEALRMALWAARDTLRQQAGAGGARAATTTTTTATTATTAATRTRSARRVLVLSAAEDPTSLAAFSTANLSAHDEAALLRVRDMVLERAGELGALGASLEVVPLGALKVVGSSPLSPTGVNMEAFWNPLMRRAQEAMEMAAAGAAGGGGAAAAAENADANADDQEEQLDNDANIIDGAQAAAMASFYTSGRVEERIEALMAHVLRQVHRRRPLARSALVLPVLGGNGNGNDAATTPPTTALTIPVAVYSLVARPTTIKPPVLVAARDNEPLRVSTALQCADTAATLAEITHFAYRPELDKILKAKRAKAAAAGGDDDATLEQQDEAALIRDLWFEGLIGRYPDVVFTKAEAVALRSAGFGRDSLWRFGVGSGGGVGEDEDEEDGNGSGNGNPSTTQNPAALAAGCYVYLGSKPMSALSDAHQLTAPVFLYPDEKQLLQQRRGGGRGGGGGVAADNAATNQTSSSSSSITAAFAALHRALLETNRFALCRSGRRSAGGGGGGSLGMVGLRLTALVPQAERVCARTGRQLQPPGFHAIALPYREDMRFPELGQLPGVERALRMESVLPAAGEGAATTDTQQPSSTAAPYYATERQVSAAEALIARLTFMDGGVDVGGAGGSTSAAAPIIASDPPPFYPSRAINPTLERHRQLVEAAALGERPPTIDWSGSGWTVRGGAEQQHVPLLAAGAPKADGNYHGGATALLLEAARPSDDAPMGTTEEDEDADDDANKQLATTQQTQQQQPPPTTTTIRVRDLDPTLPDPSAFRAARDMLAAFCDACGIGRQGRAHQRARQEAGAGQGLKRAEAARNMPQEDRDVYEAFDWKALAEATTVPVAGGLFGLTNDQLKTYLKAHALAVSGPKTAMVDRIKAHVLGSGAGSSGVGALAAGAGGAAAVPALMPPPPPQPPQPPQQQQQQQQNKRRREEEQQQQQQQQQQPRATSTAPLAVPMSDDDDGF